MKSTYTCTSQKRVLTQAHAQRDTLSHFKYKTTILSVTGKLSKGGNCFWVTSNFLQFFVSYEIN